MSQCSECVSSLCFLTLFDSIVEFCSSDVQISDNQVSIFCFKCPKSIIEPPSGQSIIIPVPFTNLKITCAPIIHSFKCLLLCFSFSSTLWLYTYNLHLVMMCHLFLFRWLALRLELIGNIMTFSAAVFAVMNRDTIGGGKAGLSITYALSVRLYSNCCLLNQTNPKYATLILRNCQHTSHISTHVYLSVLLWIPDGIVFLEKMRDESIRYINTQHCRNPWRGWLHWPHLLISTGQGGGWSRCNVVLFAKKKKKKEKRKGHEEEQGDG